MNPICIIRDNQVKEVTTEEAGPSFSNSSKKLSKVHAYHHFRTISIYICKVSSPFFISIDFLKKVNSDFPYSRRRSSQNAHSQRKSYMIKNIIESLPEMVEEEKNEEEEVSIFFRNISEINPYLD